MELLWTLLLALPTIFVAAFLAATLESFRERLRTRRWVMRNLQEFTETGRFDSASHLTAAFRCWLDAESADDMDERSWHDAWFSAFSNAPDLSPLLRSEAASSVSVEVFQALRDLEEEITTIKQVESYLRALFTSDVAPLWYERRVPLTGVDRRRVEWFLRFLTTFLAVRDRAQSSFERFRDAVRAA